VPRIARPKPAVPADLANFDQLPNAAHVRVGVVSALLAQSAATTWRRVADDPRFPRPRKLGPQHTAWNVGEIRSYLQTFAA
jgi:predicted DNA-binding transcriptional regulator AlpA